MTPGPGLGRFAEPALWVVVALGRGPASARRLLEVLARPDVPRVGPGTLMATLARLEARTIVIRDANHRPTMYRLAIYQHEGA